MVTGADEKDGAPKKLIKGNNKLPSSVTFVLSNYDLLIEILLRLPVLSLVLFKSVSKHWLRMITSPDFILRCRSENPNINPPLGLIIPRLNVEMLRSDYDFESFDIRISSRKLTVFSLGSEAPFGRVGILQSCNGLLLCYINPYKFYVYNPTIKLFKMIHTKSHMTSARMAFDPTISPHYKVIQCVPGPVVHGPGSSVQLHTYSSETGIWSVCGDRFHDISFEGFNKGVYWNDAIHWLNRVFRKTTLHVKLYIANEQPVLIESQLPVNFDRKSLLESNMFESRGCLLLIGKTYARSRRLNVYEMKNDDSEWSIKYIIKLDDIMMPLPPLSMISRCVWCIVLGEREEDSFVIIDLLNKVVQYNLVSKTIRTLGDLKPNSPPGQLATFDGLQLIPSFVGV